MNAGLVVQPLQENRLALSAQQGDSDQQRETRFEFLASVATIARKIDSELSGYFA
jgi:hypothetical protein